MELFDRAAIQHFSDTWKLFTPEQLDMIFRAAELIGADGEQRKICEQMAILIAQETDRSAMNAGLYVLKPEDDNSIFSEFAILFPALFVLRDSVGEWQKRGIPQEVIRSSLRPISSFPEQSRELKGQPGFSMFYYWLPLYAQGKLFRIGDFEFERGRISPEGNAAIGVHIPKGTDLSEQNTLASFREALAFFEKYYPEVRVSGFVCLSWLLNPKIEQLLGRKTAISRFGDLFERSSPDDNDGGVHHFLFGCATAEHPERFCETTSLQKAVKQYIMEGNRLGSCLGFLSSERLARLSELFD